MTNSKKRKRKKKKKETRTTKSIIKNVDYGIEKFRYI